MTHRSPLPFKGMKINVGRFLDLPDMHRKFHKNRASSFRGVKRQVTNTARSREFYIILEVRTIISNLV